MSLGWSAQCALPVSRPTAITNCSQILTQTILTMAVEVDPTSDPTADPMAGVPVEQRPCLDWIPVHSILLILGTIFAVLAIALGIIHSVLRRKGAVPYQIPHFCVWASKLFPFVKYKNTAIHMTFLPSLKAAENMEVKSDDVFVASFPRSGKFDEYQ